MPDTLTMDQLCALLGIGVEALDDHMVQLRVLGQAASGSAQLPALEAGASAANLAEARTLLVFNLSRYTFLFEAFTAGQPGGLADIALQVPPLTWLRVPGYWHAWQVSGAQQVGSSVPPSSLVLVVASRSRGPFEFGQLQADVAAGLSYHDPASGAKAAAASDTTLTLARPSAHVEVWNRDTTADLYFNFDQPTTKGGTDYHLKPGEYWHGQVRASTIHYQGGACEIQVWG